MKYAHVKNLQKYHPGYKDRTLQWAKIYFKVVQGDPDCEMIENEIDWGRLIKFILLELEAQKPIPLDNRYLTKKGFNVKKRPILLTLQVLHNFIEVIQSKSETCVIEKKVRGRRLEEDTYRKFESFLLTDWKAIVAKHSALPQVDEITPERRTKIKKRFLNARFREDARKAIQAIPQSPFLLGNNKREWKVSFDWLISNDTNYRKILEGKYDNKQKQRRTTIR